MESALALKKLQAKRDHPNDRALRVNLEIASGTWAALLLHVNDEWAKRDVRKADELIRTAQLAHFVKSPYAKDLVCFSAEKGSDNAHILLAAYSLATSAGWEDDSKAAEWLSKAVELSNDSGPIKSMSLKDLVDRKPEWDRRETVTWQKIHEGSMPLFAAAYLLNRSLIDMYLLPALANPSEQDPRRCGLVPAYSGARQSLPCNYRIVAMDATTLLTLAALGLLEKAGDTFDVLVIPHSTLGWLFEEKQKVSFLQPSRVKNASKLRDMLATGLLKELTGSTEVDVDLATEVGVELASLIAETQVNNNEDKRQRIVVRSSPVYKIDSLMEEEADLSVYHSHLFSCLAVVNKLKQKGQLTAIEERRARDYLSLHEKTWPHELELSLPDGAILYLDGLSVTYLQHAGLLKKLKPAGLEGYLSVQETEEIDELLRYEQLGTEIDEIIECIRGFLEAGIKTGKIRVGRIPDLVKIEELPVRNHPTLTALDLGNDVEAIFVDDRGINQHSNIDNMAGHTPILTTLDMIDSLYSKHEINLDQMFDYRIKLRQAGYLFVGITKNELEYHLSTISVADDCVVETAELKAIRENILRIRMSHFLQLPKESPWLDNLMQALILTLKAQWRSEIDEVTASARSEWLLQCLDIRGWAQCFVAGDSVNMIIHGRSAQIMSLLLAPPDIPAEIKEL